MCSLCKAGTYINCKPSLLHQSVCGVTQCPWLDHWQAVTLIMVTLHILLHVEFLPSYWTRTKHHRKFLASGRRKNSYGVKSKCLYLSLSLHMNQPTTTSMENDIWSSFYYELFKNKYTKRVQLAYYRPTTDLSLGLSGHFYYSLNFPYSTWSGAYFVRQ